MRDRDTSMFGNDQYFPTTTWAEVLKGHNQDAAALKALLADVCTRYWKPVYLYIRRAWGKSNEEAKDLTQGFFAMLLSDDVLARFQPERGRFRAFLKAVLRHFLANENRRATSAQHGGQKTVSMEAIPDEWTRMAAVADSAALSPEEIFDQEWARTLLDQSLEVVRLEMTRDGKLLQFDVYSAYVLEASPEASASYRDIAARFNIQEHDVTNYISRVRQRVQDVLRRLIADTVGSTDAALEEMRDLFSM